MYTVGPRSVRVISRELATPPLLAAAAFSGMPMRVTSALGQVRKLAAGWVPDGTAPELKDAVVNKMIFPVGVRFFEHEGDRSIFRDLRGGEVTPVEVFDVGDVRGSKKSKTVLVLAADYQGYVCCKAFTGPSFQRLQLAGCGCCARCARCDPAVDHGRNAGRSRRGRSDQRSGAVWLCLRRR